MNIAFALWLLSGAASMVMWVDYRIHNPVKKPPTTIPTVALWIMAFGSFVLVTLLGPISFFSVWVSIDREDEQRRKERTS